MNLLAATGAAAVVLALQTPAAWAQPPPPPAVVAWATVDRDGRSQLVVADGSGLGAYLVGGGVGLRGRPAVSALGDGILISAPLGEETGRYGIARVGFDGRRQLLTRPRFADVDPAWSPRDDSVVAVRRTCGSLERRACTSLVRFDARGGGPVWTLLRASRVLSDPTWSGDGADIAYTDQAGLWILPATGGRPRRLMGSRGLSEPQFSPDGRQLVVVQRLGAGHSRLVLVPRTPGRPTAITQSSVDLESPQWTPDGSQVLALAFKGVGDAGRRQQRLVEVALTRQVGVLRRMPSLAHGLSLGRLSAPMS